MASIFETRKKPSMAAAILLLLGLLISSPGKSAAQSVGVCYGQIANDLPPPAEVINMYKANGIKRIRIFNPNSETLEALRGSNIELIIGVYNDDIENLANNAATANDWVQKNIKAYLPDVRFRYISVGNEIKPNDPMAPHVLLAMQNIRASLASEEIKVSTVIDMSLMGSSYPPSTGSFSDVASSYINPIVAFLAKTGAPLLANVYPYFSYVSNIQTIDLKYALFTSPGVVVRDGNFEYQNLFAASMDALYSALEKAGGANLGVVVTESGWPSAGGIAATVENAGTYYNNLIKFIENGTPKRPGYLETYLFAMFDENQKGPAETERNFGLFLPNKQPKYQLTSFPSQSSSTSAQSVGVCYGQIANDLPPPAEVIDLYKANGIKRMRIFNPNSETLAALRGSNIELIIGVYNNDIQNLANNAAAANDWVQTNIKAYLPDVRFRYISVGNEIKPNDPMAPYVLLAMQNIHAALASEEIKVSTVIDMSLLGSSYPPSAGSFSDAATVYMNQIVAFLAKTGAPLLANVYPYFSYVSNTQTIDINYALFTSPGVVVRDGNFEYQNLFAAIMDALYSALEKVAGANVSVVVTESGWPSAGGIAATVENAKTYYSNLIKFIKNGTPKRPGYLETYLFAMFDENQKGPAETERNFGLFLPNKQPKYQLTGFT